jgi:hypothetical protein
MRQRRQRSRSLQHRAALSEAEAVHGSTVANEPSLWPPPSPPSVLPSSLTPLTLTIPAVARPLSRRLTIVMAQPQAAEAVVESRPRCDQTASNPASLRANRVLFTGQAAAVSGAEGAVASDSFLFTVSEPS